MIEPHHSSIEAVARHMMATRVRGSFGSFSGSVEVAQDVTDSTIEVTIDAASIDTGVEDRDQHPRSEDPGGNPRALFEATTILQRSDWGMTWNQALEAGGVLVSKSVDVEISVQLVREEDAG